MRWSWLIACALSAPAWAGDEAGAPPVPPEVQRRMAEIRARLNGLAAEEARLESRLPTGPTGTAPVSSLSGGELAFERARLAAARARREAGPAAAPPPAAPIPAPVEEVAEASEPAPAEPPAEDGFHEDGDAHEPPPPPEEPTEAHAGPVRTPIQLADAQLATGDATAALASYKAAAEDCEIAGDPAGTARARYGVGRTLERLGRTDEALKAYLAVEDLPQPGPWARAAKFARGWISWRQRLEEIQPGRSR